MTRQLKAFISYSHADEPDLDRLKKHLAMLRREEVMAAWFDQMITAGGDIDATISKHLDECDIFIPLVSADFLASRYCYEREMTRALELHEKAKLRIVPVIVGPCDWQASPLGKLKAVPKDGKPVSEWTNPNTAWLDVVQQLRRVADECRIPDVSAGSNERATLAPATRYRVKRDFDEVDKLEFREKSLNEIRDYFQKASAEINEVDGIKAKFTAMGEDAFTCTVVNRGRERAIAHITVRARSSSMSIGDLYYCFSENAKPGTATGWFDIVSDDYDLHLKMQIMYSGNGEKERLSPRQAAERLWEQFIEQADITYG
jgi:hypothetical protein